MPAWEHPDWNRLLSAWRAARFATEERRLAALALADASEEMDDTWSAYVWREVIARSGKPAPGALGGGA